MPNRLSMKDNFKAHLSVLVANIIYGANYSIAKLVMPAFIQPFGFILIRVGVSAILFFLMSRFFITEKIDPADRKRLILCAVFGIATNQLLFFKGLSLTSPINSGLIMVTNPLFVLILSGIFLQEKIGWKRIVGIVSGILGAVILIVYGNRHSGSVSNPLGDLFIMLNSLSYAVYLVMTKPLMYKYHPVTIMKYVFVSGAFMVFPFGFNDYMQIHWSTFTGTIWAATFFVVIGTTFFAYLFNTLALRSLSPGVVSVYIYLQPVMAAGFAMLLGKDQPSVVHLISAIFIFAGVYLTTSSVQRKVVKG